MPSQETLRSLLFTPRIYRTYFAVRAADQSITVYAPIAFYLNHQEEVEAYLSQRQQQAQKIRQANEARFDPQGLRDRLLARQVEKNDQAASR